MRNLFIENIHASGVAVDSRKVQPGNLFFALEGAKVNGHDFIDEAASKGAVGSVVKKSYSKTTHQIPLIHVECPLTTLQVMAKDVLKDFKGKIGAVTGSLGKTTTKGFLTTLLEEKYYVGSTPGNSNSQIGLPLSILNHTTGKEDVLIFEMGITHLNQLPRLIDIAPPDIALITTIAPVHIANFSSLEELALAKAAIFSHPKTSVGILCRDLEFFDVMSRVGSCKKMSFSMTQEADFSGKGKGTGTGAEVGMGKHVLGEHNQYNLLAASAAASCFGLNWQEIERAIPKLSLPEKRLEQVIKNGVLFVNDSYNASEASIKAALKSLPEGRRRIGVIGDIVDLGSYATSCYQNIGAATLAHLDLLICIGSDCGIMVDAWQRAQKPVFWCKSLNEIAERLRLHVGEGDVVLLKGSNKHKLWEILNL